MFSSAKAYLFRNAPRICRKYSLGRYHQMIKRPRPERFRLRRTMMFMNAQKPGLIKDAYIYGCDSIMLDLEDAVAENQKDAARFSLYHALTSIDYGDTRFSIYLISLPGKYQTPDTATAHVMHSHFYYELHYASRGQCLYRFSDREVLLQEGQMLEWGVTEHVYA